MADNRVQKQPRIKVPESGVLRACLDLLAVEHIWHVRMNSGAFLPHGKGKGIVRAGRPGLADILASAITRQLGTAAFIWIECKSDTGQQSQDQKEFQAEVQREGHIYLLVRSSDDLKNFLTRFGVIKSGK